MSVHDIKNLLEETSGEIARHGKSSADVVFIGSTDGSYSCTWDEFRVLADETYDSGYGGARVAGDLRIVFSDGSFMVRGEYDGSEWWDFYAPALNNVRKGAPIRSVFRGATYAHDLDGIHSAMARDDA